MLDPVVMAEAAGFTTLDDWQRRLLCSRERRVMLNCARQVGKSSMTALLALHQALYTPHSLILVLARAERQSGELFKKVLDLYRKLDRPVAAVAETATTLTLTNHSRILALPGDESTVRSYSAVSLLVVDEASRVPDPTYYSVLPMLAVSGGRLITMSTPFGSRGWWYEAWRNREAEGWLYIETPATECERIAPAFLAEQKRAMGQFWFDQEYMCRFLDSRSSAFRTEDIEAALTDDALLPGIEYFLAPDYDPNDPEATEKAVMADLQDRQRRGVARGPSAAAIPVSAFLAPEGLKRMR